MKGLRLYLLAGAALLVIYIVIQYNRPKPTNWNPTYFNSQKIPFGTYILYNRIKDIFPGASVTTPREPIYTTLADSAYRNTAYVIICNAMQPSKADFEQLTNYIKAGNDVFIAADNFGDLFEKELKLETFNAVWEKGNAEYISFVNPALDAERQYFVDKNAIQGYFTNLDSTKAVLLGQTDERSANFVKYTIGKGSLYLSTNPKMFTNYSLLKPQGAQYASIALSYLGAPKQVLWDEYYTQGSVAQDSPMRVFLNNAALRSAYYLAIFSLLIYVIYGIKRRQRAIPVVEPLKNSTVEFVNVVGQVYYERRDNQNIAFKKIMYFLGGLRDKYQLKTGQLDREFTVALAKKAGLEQIFANDLVNYINYISHQQQVNDHELIELNRLIEKFYTLSA